MKKISYWAKQHPVSGRFIIIFSFVLLTLLGIVTGTLLNDLDIVLSPLWIVAVVAIYLAGVVAYPARTLKHIKLSASAFYMRQKTCDLLLTVSTFCMIIYFSNQPGRLFQYTNPIQAAAPLSQPIDSLVKYKTMVAFSASMKDETGKTLKWKERKKLLKQQVKAIKRSDMSKGGKTALIILSVLVAAGLIMLVLGLACNISCSGSEGAAILVGIGGVGLVIFLLVLVIRGITGKKRKKKNKEDVLVPDGQ